MFENGALMKIFLSKREEIRGQRGELHCEDPHRWYSSADVVRVIKVKERGTGFVTQCGKSEVHTLF